MGLARFKASNHPQQVSVNGVVDDIDDRATSPEWFAELHAKYAFTLDVAAAAHNAKLPRYFTKAQNGLLQSWEGERVFGNIPFSKIRPWLEKAWSETRAPLVVLLVPANRTEQAWWQDLVEPFRDRPASGLRVEFIRHRRRFIKAGDDNVKANDRPPFGVCLLIWERQP
jgi:phage N-6-adenine-methyltransferase